MMENLLSIFVNSVFVGNILLAYFLGMCSYLCGPPPMVAAVEKMLYDLGVEPEMIAYDKFG